MTIFGWCTIVVWTILTIGTAMNAKKWSSSLFCAFMLLGTLVWGTGSL